MKMNDIKKTVERMLASMNIKAEVNIEDDSDTSLTFLPILAVLSYSFL